VCLKNFIYNFPLKELVREKFALQTQVNESYVQISGLRTQLDEMRYSRGVGATDVPDAAKRLEMERDKSDDKDTQVSVDMKKNRKRKKGEKTTTTYLEQF